MGHKRADGEGSYFHEQRKNKKGEIVKDIWHFLITVDGKRHNFSASKKRGGKSAAKAKYDAWDEARKAGQLTVSPDITLEEWMDKYLETCRKGTMRDTSYHQLELLADKLPAGLKEKRVKDIVPIELQSFMNKFAATASKSYTDKMAGLIRSAFAEATENDICVKNPARKLKTPKKRDPLKHAFTSTEAQIILNFTQTYHQSEPDDSLRKRAGLVTGAAVITLLWTGIRRGELLGLMWTDIKDGKLTIN